MGLVKFLAIPVFGRLGSPGEDEIVATSRVIVIVPAKPNVGPDNKLSNTP